MLSACSTKGPFTHTVAALRVAEIVIVQVIRCISMVAFIQGIVGRKGKGRLGWGKEEKGRGEKEAGDRRCKEAEVK